MAQLSKSLTFPQMLSKWSGQLNPLLANLFVQGSQISGITLIASTPQAINHLLGKMQTGWVITDQDAAASIYRTEPFNMSILTLEASADCTISLWVY